MKKIWKALLGHGAELVFAAGALATAAGAYMMSPAMGLIVGGFLTMTGAVVSMIGGTK